MPGSIALTRIHTPEDYWLRMALAEQKLCDRWDEWLDWQNTKANLCLKKAGQLSDRYHEHWTTTRKDYFG